MTNREALDLYEAIRYNLPHAKFKEAVDVAFAALVSRSTSDKRGRWLPQIVLGERAWDCSECKTLGSPHWKWCPVCGTRMEGT